MTVAHAILCIVAVVLTALLIKRFRRNSGTASTDVGDEQELQTREYDELRAYPFLREATEEEIQSLPSDCGKIRFLFCEGNQTHYKILDGDFHSDEQKLSELRVKLYERSNLSPEPPLLVCSSCGRQVYLTGSPGIKGQIVKFCHEGEGHSSSDTPSPNSFQEPKTESESELKCLADCFCAYKDSLESFHQEDTFLAIPGTSKTKAGDITFSLDSSKVAVIFVSAGHTLDFIIRRARHANHNKCTPIWILTKELIHNHGMSVRDISTFAGGYVCSVDEETVRRYKDTGLMELYSVTWETKEEAYIPLEKYIKDSGKNLKSILEANPVNHRKKQPGKQKKSKTASPPEPNIQPLSDIATPARQKITYTPVDYWEGKRFHIKDDLYLEEINGKYGILNLAKNRSVFVPMFDRIDISSDKNSIIAYRNGKAETYLPLALNGYRS